MSNPTYSIVINNKLYLELFQTDAGAFVLFKKEDLPWEYFSRLQASGRFILMKPGGSYLDFKSKKKAIQHIQKYKLVEIRSETEKP